MFNMCLGRSDAMVVQAAICVPVKSSMGWSPNMEQKCNDVEHVKINQLNQTEHWTDSVFDIFCDLQHFVWQVPQVPSTLT